MNKTEKLSKIEQFIRYRPKNTKKNYTAFLNQYFRTVNADPETYFDNGRNYKQDIENYWDTQLTRPPLTKFTRLSCIKTFLERNGVEFKHTFWKEIKTRIDEDHPMKGKRAMTIDATPTNEQLKKILIHGTVHDKAMFLMACSSGMRINEILKLKEINIDLKSKPAIVRLPGEITKNGEPRTTFLSAESVEFLEEWLKEREHYIDVAIRKTGNLCKKDRKDGTIFPHGYNVAWMRWKSLIYKAGFTERDPTTNRHRYHIHCLRKYFISNMGVAGVPRDVYEAMAGHEGYLSRSYRHIQEREMIDGYKKGVKNLLVFETSSDERINEFDEQLKEKESRIRQLEEQIQTKNIAQEIIGNPAFRTEMMNLLKKEMENEKK